MHNSCTVKPSQCGIFIDRFNIKNLNLNLRERFFCNFQPRRFKFTMPLSCDSVVTAVAAAAVLYCELRFMVTLDCEHTHTHTRHLYLSLSLSRLFLHRRLDDNFFYFFISFSCVYVVACNKIQEIINHIWT
jgi:hypothetical protein